MSEQQAEILSRDREFLVREIPVLWNGKLFKLTADSVLKAFERSDSGDPVGPKARFYLEMNGEIKSVLSVVKCMIPVKDEELTDESVEKFAKMFEVLGFSVLDRRDYRSLE